MKQTKTFDMNNKIMLHFTDKSIIDITTGLYPIYESERDLESKEIYILSNDEIEEGDWIFNLTSLSHDPLIHQATNIDDVFLSTKDSLHAKGLVCGCRNFKTHYLKINASNDEYLKLHEDSYILIEKIIGILQPSQDFTQVLKCGAA